MTHCEEKIRNNALGRLGLGQVLEEKGNLHAAFSEFRAADRLASDVPPQVREVIRQKIEEISPKVKRYRLFLAKSVEKALLESVL